MAKYYGAFWCHDWNCVLANGRSAVTIPLFPRNRTTSVIPFLNQDGDQSPDKKVPRLISQWGVSSHSILCSDMAVSKQCYLLFPKVKSFHPMTR